MNTNKKIGIIIIVEALAIIILLRSLGVCEHTGSSPKCYYCFLIDNVLGIIVLLIGIITILVKRHIYQYSIIASLGFNILMILAPYKIVGLCVMPDMICRKYTFPAVSFTIIIVSVILIFFFLNSARRSKKR